MPENGTNNWNKAGLNYFYKRRFRLSIKYFSHFTNFCEDELSCT